MTVLDDFSKIPRKHRNGLGSNKSITSVYINPVTLEAARSTAKLHNVSLSGLMELALDRLLADVTTEEKAAWSPANWHSQSGSGWLARLA
jgi:hypothetical protein